MVDAPPSAPPHPLSVEGSLLPGLLQAEDARVDDTTDTAVREPVQPVVELHPVRVCVLCTHDCCLCVCVCVYYVHMIVVYVYVYVCIMYT